MEFQLNGRGYIQLNQMLKHLSLVSSGGEAKMRITEGEALVNGLVETQIRKKLKEGDVVEFGGEKVTVKK